MRKLLKVPGARLATASVALALLLGACQPTTQPSPSASGPTGFDLTPFEEAAAAAAAPAEYIGPDDSPPIAEDKIIAVILCAAAAEGCVRIGTGVQEAADLVGWEVQLLDGEGQASVFNTVMLDAITQQVDGIVLVAIDSKLVGDAMARAHAAGIPVVSVVGGNIAAPDDVFSEVNSQALRAGEQLGNWVVADSGGQAKIAMFTAPEFTDARRRYEGGKSVFDRCTTCEIVSDTEYVASTAAQEIPLQTKSILQANPEIDYIFTDIGQFGALQVQAINELGLQDEVKLVSFDCNPEDLRNLRDGNVQAACNALQLEAGGWGAVDELNRAFNNAEAGGDVVPIRVINANNVPAGDSWDGDFDFRGTYRELWGL
jgi:ribose transport system substrate-binding protein